MEYAEDGYTCVWYADDANPLAGEADYGCDLWFEATEFTDSDDVVHTKAAHCACHETYYYSDGPGTGYRLESYLGVYPNKVYFNSSQTGVEVGNDIYCEGTVVFGTV